MRNFSKVFFRFGGLLTILFLHLSVYAQWQCPTNCSCANNEVSVTCFGASPNDGISDTTAIQSAIDSVPDNWTVYFPTGRYMVGSLPDPSPTDSNRVKGLEIERDNINLVGEGIGSELYTPQNTNFILLSIPSRDASQGCPRIIPKNVSIQRISFSGDLNRGTQDCPITTETGCSLLFGVFIWNGEDILISDVLFKDFGLEGVLLGNGTATPKNIMIQRIKTQRFRRNAVHIGYGENITIQDSVFEDSNDPIWLPAASSGSAIDLETEGLDLLCSSNPKIPHTYRVPYVYNFTIKNNLIKSPTSLISQGGIYLGMNSGPIRKVNISDNILINSGGILSSSFTFTTNDWKALVDPRVGKSLRNRDIEINSNWISNLHTSGDISTSALTIYAGGDVSDLQGTNNVRINNNVLTTYQFGGNNRLFQFSTNKEIYGNNNKTFRPYSTYSDPLNAGINFLWRKDHPPYFLPSQTPNYDNFNVQILNTIDNGWEGSRLVCYDPIPVSGNWNYCNSIGGTGNSLTWVNNPNPTPTTAPSITQISIQNSIYLWFSVSRNINEEPVRIEILHNNLPLGLKKVVFDGSSLSTKTFIKLNRKAKKGDVFKILAFSETGKFTEYTYTY